MDQETLKVANKLNELIQKIKIAIKDVKDGYGITYPFLSDKTNQEIINAKLKILEKELNENLKKIKQL